MKAFDTFAENTSRRLARKLSRRNILSKLGALLCASGTLPILPMARADSKNLNTDLLFFSRTHYFGIFCQQQY